MSGGRKKRIDVLEQFWSGFSAAVANTEELRIGEVLDRLSDILVPQVLTTDGSQGDIRICPNCGNGRLTLKTGRASGAFLGCSAYPECQFTLSLDGTRTEVTTETPAVRRLGVDPETELEVTARPGRYGPYVQLGESGKGKSKPKRAGIPKEMDPQTLDLETALSLLALPRPVGSHPDDGEPIEAGIGRYGPYLKHGKKYVSVADANEVLTVGMNRAVELLAQGAKGPRGRSGRNQGKDLGEHPADGGAIRLLDGRYGPYVKWSRVNASLPKDMDAGSLTLDQAVELIEAKRGKGK